MPFTPFTPLHRITGNTGSLPASVTPADEIIFKYQFQLDASELEYSTGDIVIKTVGADFLLSGPDGSVILAWGFSLTYVLAQDEFGFSWYSNDDEQKLTVTQPVPPPGILGSPNGIDLVGGGMDSSGTDIVQDGFESPIFVVNVPPGSTVKITFHDIGFPFLDDIEGVSVSTRLGGAAWASGYRHGGDGEGLVLYAGKTDAQLDRFVGRERAQIPGDALGWGATGPGVLLRGAATARSVYPKGADLYARASNSDAGTWEDAVLIYSGMTLLGGVNTGAGSILLMQDKSGNYFAGYGDRSGSFTDPAPAVMPTGVKPTAGVLLYDGNGLDFCWTGADGLNHIHSDTDGTTWD